MSIMAVGGWLAGWSESQIAGIASVGRPLAISAIRQGLGLGLSGNQMQKILSGLGVGIRRQNLQGMVRSAQIANLSAQQAARFDLHAIPTAGKVHEDTFGTMTGYYHKVNVTFTEVIDGERSESTMRVIIRTEEPITVAEASRRAKDVFDTMGTHDSGEGRTFLYSEYGGVVRQIAKVAV